MEYPKAAVVSILISMRPFNATSVIMNFPKHKYLVKTLTRNPRLLFWYYMVVNMVPSFYFFFTEPLNIFGKLIVLLFPFGFYLFLFSLVRNTGKWQLFLFPLFFLHAFQIVLFYLFGHSVITSNMFLNLVTTNSSEVNELLGVLLPSILIVILLYVPPTVFAARQWRQKNIVSKTFRKKTFKTSIGILILTLIISFFSEDLNTHKFAYHKNIYPVNLFYNLGLTVQKYNKLKQYPETAKDFTFDAERKNTPKKREIIVLVVGETSRPMNWELFGYHRKNNPNLVKQENLVIYPDALTQSNVTHQSVPIMLSSVGASNFKDLYHQKGIFQAYEEAGFTTICLSNQAENSSTIEYIYKQANIYQNIKNTDSHSDPNPPDEVLTEMMDDLIDQNPGDLFIVLHSYGSHFKYKDRYPSNFSKYQPDKITNVSKAQKKEMVNAYDNSILYTDYFLSKTIEVLEKTRAASFLLYASDHGEDIFDDDRGKFLHASPTPTYYQLRIAFLSWFSNSYQKAFPEKITAMTANHQKPITTSSIFHTLMDAATISTPYFNPKKSLLNPNFTKEERLFLTDHEEGIPYLNLNLDSKDRKLLKQNHIGS